MAPCAADVAASGMLLYQKATFVNPPELWIGSQRITALNDDLVRTVTRPDVHKLEVTAPDGFRTDAWALTPPGQLRPVADRALHPRRAFGCDRQLVQDRLPPARRRRLRRPCPQLPRLERIRHRARASDPQRVGPEGCTRSPRDLDEAIRQGIADPDRIGVTGLSHGGFATCWLVGTSDRFKAGIAENPVTNWVSFYGITDTETWTPSEMEGTPDEVPENYRERSPLTYAHNCTAPLLFIIGEHDWRCHATESEQYYRVLRNGIPTGMLRLPNTEHSGSAWGPVPARVAQNEALIDWFTRYLK